MKNLATIFGLMKLRVHAFMLVWYVTVECVTRGKCIQIEIYDGDNKNANEISRHPNAKHQRASSASTRASFDKSSSRMSRGKRARYNKKGKNHSPSFDLAKWQCSDGVSSYVRCQRHFRINVNNIGTAQILWRTRTRAPAVARSRKFRSRGILWFWAEKWGHMNKIAGAQPLKYWMRNYSHSTDRTIQSKSCYPCPHHRSLVMFLICVFNCIPD